MERWNTSLTPHYRIQNKFSFDSVAQGQVIASLLNPTGDDSTVLATCPSGNCDFPRMRDQQGREFTHRSPGICSKCLDVTRSLRHNTNRTQEPRLNGSMIGASGRGFAEDYQTESWYLGATHRLEYTFHYRWRRENESMDSTNQVYSLEMPFLNISSVYSMTPSHLNLPDSARLVEEYNELATISVISMDSLGPNDTTSLDTPRMALESTWMNMTPSATICVLHPCLRTYLATFENSELKETVVASEILETWGDARWETVHQGRNSSRRQDFASFPTEMMAIRTPCIVNGQLYTSDNRTSGSDASTAQLSRLPQDAWNHTRSGSLPTSYRPPHNKWNIDQETVARLQNITAPRQCLYGIDMKEGWFSHLSDMLQRIMSGECFIGYMNEGDGDVCQSHNRERFLANETDRSSRKQPLLAPFWLEGMASLNNRSAPELSKYMEAVAESLSRKFRTGMFPIDNRSAIDNEWRGAPEMVVGQVWRTTTCFAVDWRWLTLSATLTVLTAFALIWTIVRAVLRGDVIWKSSVLPLIYYRSRIVVVEREDGEGKDSPWTHEQDLMDVKEMRADSRRVKIVF